MILVRLMGGMGNQMFQYAAGRYLAEKNKTVLKLDRSLLELDPPPGEIKRDYELGRFNIREVFASKSEIEYFNPTDKRIHKRVLRKIATLAGPQRTYIQQGTAFDASVVELEDNRGLVGSLQSEKYFADISDIIRKEFTFKKAPSTELKSHIDKIRNSNSVCLHIRRGDYVKSAIYSKTLGALELGYYEEAVNRLTNQFQDIELYIFSDDPDWCRENLNFPVTMHFVSGNFTKDDPDADFRLMRSCRHFIISNSTFSWWAAWLGDGDGKIVVAPRAWSVNGSMESDDRIPESWLKL